MDLSVVQDALNDFSTFVRNIAGLFENLPKVIADIAGFFETKTVDGEETMAGSSLANETSSTLGSSEADSADAGSAQ